MLYASKIDFTIPSELISMAQTRIVTFDNILHMYKFKNRREIFKLLPESLQNKIITVYFSNVLFNENKQTICIHEHKKEKCVINYYLETNNEKTNFYVGDSVIIKNNSRYKEFLPNILNKIESFIAKSGESWLMDTTKPHNIESMNDNKSRKMIQIYFYDAAYNEVLNAFNRD